MGRRRWMIQRTNTAAVSWCYRDSSILLSPGSGTIPLRTAERPSAINWRPCRLLFAVDLDDDVGMGLISETVRWWISGGGWGRADVAYVVVIGAQMVVVWWRRRVLFYFERNKSTNLSARCIMWLLVVIIPQGKGTASKTQQACSEDVTRWGI